MQLETTSPSPLLKGVYFHGCAWGIGFYIGVLQTLKEAYGVSWNQHPTFEYAGDSIGALVAIVLALGLDVAFLDQLSQSLINRASQYPFYHLRSSDVHNEVIDTVFEEATRIHGPTVDLIDLLRMRLRIGVTKYFEQHHWGMFETIDDLRNLIHGSFHIPVYCRAISHYNNHWLVDGAFSFCPHNDLFDNGAHTLVVGIVGDDDDKWCDIHPTNAYSRTQCMIPDMSQYLCMRKDGRKAATAWLRMGGIPKIKHCRSPQRLILAMVWVMRAVEQYVLFPYKRSCL